MQFTEKLGSVLVLIDMILRSKGFIKRYSQMV